jgi:sorting nexin-27
VFPHCPCDSRKEGHVIATISAENFELQACKEDGALEVNNLALQYFNKKIIDI